MSHEELKKTVERINKEFGAGAIMNLGQRTAAPVRAISTGSLLVDEALGVGGLPRGRIVEVFGPESSGKTTLALHAIASAQKSGGVAAFIDAEHALDPAYAKGLGVNLDQIYLSQPACGEEALEIVDQLIRSGDVDVIVIDSVAALAPRAEIEGAMGDAHVGLQARLMSQAMRKLTASIARTSTVVIFINQIREKVGVMFGPSETTSGGRALKFYASVRIEVRRKEQITENGRVTGSKTRIKVVKNKLAPPFREAIVDVIFSRGICRVAERLNIGIDTGIVAKSGAWISLDGVRLGQGVAAARQFLELNPAVLDKLERAILKSRKTAEGKSDDCGATPRGASTDGGRAKGEAMKGEAKAA